MASLDTTICPRCEEPMAAVIGQGSLPRNLCRYCGNASLSAPLPAVSPPSKFFQLGGHALKARAGPVVVVGNALEFLGIDPRPHACQQFGDDRIQPSHFVIPPFLVPQRNQKDVPKCREITPRIRNFVPRARCCL